VGQLGWRSARSTLATEVGCSPTLKASSSMLPPRARRSRRTARPKAAAVGGVGASAGEPSERCTVLVAPSSASRASVETRICRALAISPSVLHRSRAPPVSTRARWERSTLARRAKAGELSPLAWRWRRIAPPSAALLGPSGSVSWRRLLAWRALTVDAESKHMWTVYLLRAAQCIRWTGSLADEANKGNPAPKDLESTVEALDTLAWIQAFIFAYSRPAPGYPCSSPPPRSADSRPSCARSQTICAFLGGLPCSAHQRSPASASRSCIASSGRSSSSASRRSSP
jgi:hypothetical protein